MKNSENTLALLRDIKRLLILQLLTSGISKKQVETVIGKVKL